MGFAVTCPPRLFARTEQHFAFGDGVAEQRLKTTKGGNSWMK
jgi:hypothetical protein